MPNKCFFSNDYLFAFNGKEKDNETYGDGNEYDYGFRIYNPRLGQFLSVDPLAKEFPSFSPYPFAQNCPIKFVDLDGTELAVRGVASQDFINILAARTGLIITQDANGFLNYATTGVYQEVSSSQDGPLDMDVIYTTVPVIASNDATQIDFQLRQNVMDIINGKTERVDVLALTAAKIMEMSPTGTDDVKFDKFPFSTKAPNDPDREPSTAMFDGSVDVTDLQNIGSEPLFQGAIMNHFLTERGEASKGFDISHESGNLAELSSIRQLDPSASLRNDANFTLYQGKYSQSMGDDEAYGNTFDYGSTKFTTKCHFSQTGGGFLNPNQVKGVDKNVR